MYISALPSKRILLLGDHRLDMVFVAIINEVAGFFELVVDGSAVKGLDKDRRGILDPSSRGLKIRY